MKKQPSRLFKQNMMLISTCIFLLGVVLLLVSEPFITPTSPWGWAIMRDLGVALCSTGLISVAYEVLIRDQLLEDHLKTIETVINPDAKRLGVLRIFANRAERGAAGLSMESLIEKAQSELFLCAEVPVQTLGERRPMLTELIRRGGTVKLLMFDPSSANIDALDDTLAYMPGALPEGLDNVREAIRKLRAAVREFNGQDRLIVRCHDVVLPFKILAVDRETDNGTFVVELNGLNLADDDHASFELSKEDGGLYYHYCHQVDTLWENARPFDESIPCVSHLNESGIAVGWQSELYDRALKICSDRGIKRAVLYHYSGSTVQATIRDLLRNGWDIDMIVEGPDVARAIHAANQEARISGMIKTFRCYEDALKSHFKIRTSRVPNSVRAAIFGDELIVLGWYFYLALSKSEPNALPDLEVNGDGTFGVLIDCSNPAFSKVRDFLNSYETALGAEVVRLSGPEQKKETAVHAISGTV